MAWSKRRKLTKKEKENISRKLKKYFSNPAVRKKLSKDRKKYFSNPIIKKKISESLKKYFSKSGTKERLSKIIKEYWLKHPEGYAKRMENSEKTRSSPAFKKKMSRIKKKQYKQNPEIIKKIDRIVTKWWHEHPNIRKERSEAAKRLFINNPDKFRKFMKYGNNPASPRFKTKQHFLVRSRGEQQIANFLHDNRINNSYESKTLIFEKEGQICVPDFWLPNYKMNIEFYGGYPGSWKKKVMKNKLYKKYKIPCIFITPAELRNLDYYLKRKLK